MPRDIWTHFIKKNGHFTNDYKRSANVLPIYFVLRLRVTAVKICRLTSIRIHIKSERLIFYNVKSYTWRDGLYIATETLLYHSRTMLIRTTRNLSNLCPVGSLDQALGHQRKFPMDGPDHTVLARRTNVCLAPPYNLESMLPTSI